jgi:hypothetical protein
MAVNCSHCGADNPPGGALLRPLRRRDGARSDAHFAAGFSRAGDKQPGKDRCILPLGQVTTNPPSSRSSKQRSRAIRWLTARRVLMAHILFPKCNNRQCGIQHRHLCCHRCSFPLKASCLPGRAFWSRWSSAASLCAICWRPVAFRLLSRLNPDRQREVRLLMTGDPEMAASPPFAVQRPLSLRSAWVFGLLALAVIAPLVFGWVQPAGQVQQWPGVESAYTAIASLPPASTVLVNWAYDPASAGELDMVALPAISQLLEGGHQSLAVHHPTGRDWRGAALVCTCFHRLGKSSLASNHCLGPAPASFSVGVRLRCRWSG